MIESFKGCKPIIGKEVYIHMSALVSGQVTLGDYSNIWFNASLRGDIGEILIGQSTNIQDNSVIHNTIGKKVVVGDYVTVGHGAILHSCRIGNQTLVGMGAIILDDAVIGNNCLIGAGALVTPRQVVLDNSLVLGNPAKVIRLLTEEEIKNNMINAEHYVSLAKEYCKKKEE